MLQMANYFDPNNWPPGRIMFMAAAGGAAPTLLKLAGNMVGDPNAPMPGLGMWVGILLFCVIGLLLCIAFEEKHVRQAFVLGVAAPGLITNLVNGSTEAARNIPIRPPASAPATGAAWFLTPAHAQDRARTNIPSDTATIRFVPLNSAVHGVVSENPSGSIELRINPQDSQQSISFGFSPGTSTFYPFQKSDLASGITIEVRYDRFQRTIRIDERVQAINIFLVTSIDFSVDLKWALGGQKIARVQDLRVEAVPPGM
jgi:hypothetical protein